ncbi:peptide ABC transporter substrate-binding protein [Roseomonas sp. HJA6]|uniref:Peptide ABC transporter substrate-binding protein n=1 Tax=Roseomonas alba TaxID=2846776 RepID=A0ABS7A827_9PROT|nr:ABC transporter substrate-binding protein [Neoroseomonas alba]MBW6398250.1 peptide ABC transporter substrate-binding protein [Neoroseomonas alba]
MTLTRRSFMAGAAGAPLITAIGPRAAQAQTSVLRYGLQLYPPTFNPWQHAGTAAATVNICHRRGLLSYSADGQLRGELAEAWESDDTGWRFRLRDAWFHNGEKLTSADVRYTIEQIAGERSTAYLRANLQQIAAIETPDDKTVRLVTRQPIATLPNWLALPQAPIVCRGTGAGADAVGCGPFRIEENERGVAVRLVPAARYYRPGLPKVQRLNMTVYADENARVAALQTGDVDLIEYVPWQSIDSLAANPAVKLDSTFGPFMHIIFNGRAGSPFADPRVRRAVAFAIQRDDVRKAAFFGHASVVGGLPLPESSPFYNAEMANGWTYDPARAKQLLAEAGHANGFSCNLLSNVTNGMHKSTAEVVQQNLAAIGIDAQLALPDWAGFVTRATRGQYDIAVNGTTSDSQDVDGFASVMDGSLSPASGRSANMNIPELTRLFAEGRAEFDTAKRKAIYDQVQRILIEQVPVCFLVKRTQAYAMRQNVQGFHNLPEQLTFYSGVTLEEVQVA